MLKNKLVYMVVSAAVVALGLASLGAGANRATPLKLKVPLNARQEVPPPAVKAPAPTGLFTATLSGNTLTWRLTFARLSGPAIGAHIHLGKPGVAGPVAVPLCGPCKPGAQGKTTVSAKVAKAIRGGATYTNVHTQKNPAGEIRGQLGSAKVAAATPSPTTTTTSGGYGRSYGATPYP